MNLCKYKDVLGVPKQGFHSKRFYGYAINDVLGTFFIAFLITIIFYRKNFLINFIIISLLLFILAILLHRLFCVNTTLNVQIFGKV